MCLGGCVKEINRKSEGKWTGKRREKGAGKEEGGERKRDGENDGKETERYNGEKKNATECKCGRWNSHKRSSDVAKTSKSVH